VTGEVLRHATALSARADQTPTNAPVGLAPNAIALRCEGLIKRFGAMVAVNGLSFQIARGECFGLLGPNGAGKSTSMEILEGLTERDAGIVEVLGRPWTAQHRSWLRARLGVQLQQTELPDRLTVVETIRLFRSFYPRGPAVAQLLRMVSLEEKRDTRVHALSGGQKQRLSLACAMAGEPELLFLDEPSTGLDPQSRLAVWEVIEQFLQRGGTVLITTHYMDEADRLCRRVAIVDHGEIIALGSPAELKSDLAGAQVLEFELERGAVDHAQLAQLPAVERVHGGSRSWRLGSTAIGATLPALTRLLDARADRVRTLSTRLPTLEDVFVSLTGRALRDE
jgi:ABC-2 type transport system ATP-binding protein